MFFFECSCDHRDLHVLTHSFPTRRSSDLLYVFLSSWNDFMWPLIILADQDLYTLPVALAAHSRQNVQDYEIMMAGAVVTTLPVLILFLALQRYYLSGLLTGSVKG